MKNGVRIILVLAILLVVAKACEPDNQDNTVGTVPETAAEKQAAAERTAKELAAEKASEAKFEKTAAGKIWLKHKDWDREICGVIAHHKVRVGMDENQVLASWGRPYKINKTISGSHVSEQWVMHEDDDEFLYFDDGILTSIQVSQ